MEGFKIYTEDDTLGYSYAVSNKIKTVSGTIEIFGRNVVAGFAYGVLGVIAAAVILITALFARKKIAKGRDEKINSHGNAESDSKMKILAEESTDGKENDNEAE